MGMKAKTIKAVLNKKFEDWLSTIQDDTIRSVVKHNTIITGGCIASMLAGEQVNDFDVYFRTHEAALLVAKHYLVQFSPKKASGIPLNIFIQNKDGRIKIVVQSAGIASESGVERPYSYFESSAEGEAGRYVDELMTDPGEIADTYDALNEEVQSQPDEEGKPRYRPVFVSTNAITLSNRIQLVLRFYGEPEEIHSNYDYVHCTNYWTSWDNKLVLRQEALESILAKELRYTGSKYPICSMLRLRKFIARGWRINAGQLLKIAMQIAELNLKDHGVLEDQLTGVDVAYFAEVIGKLRDKDPERVNAAYLVEIIDRMF